MQCTVSFTPSPTWSGESESPCSSASAFSDFVRIRLAKGHYRHNHSTPLSSSQSSQMKHDEGKVSEKSGCLVLIGDSRGVRTAAWTSPPAPPHISSGWSSSWSEDMDNNPNWLTMTMTMRRRLQHIDWLIGVLTVIVINIIVQNKPDGTITPITPIHLMSSFTTTLTTYDDCCSHHCIGLQSSLHCIVLQSSLHCIALWWEPFPPLILGLISTLHILTHLLPFFFLSDCFKSSCSHSQPSISSALLYCRCPRSLACWWWAYIWLWTTLFHILSTLLALRCWDRPCCILIAA